MGILRAIESRTSLPIRRLLVLIWGGLAASQAGGATVWTGPLITYSQPSPNPTQPANQDRITPDVWLTRAASKGLFNAYSETNAGTLSPANTEWAFGYLTNYAALSYSNWLAWLNGQSPVILSNQPVVLHLISDDIYLSVDFTFWASGGSGGFAYQRSTAPVAPTLQVANSTTALSNGQFTFTYTATAGLSYVVESSTDLSTWLPIQTNLASTNTVVFTRDFSPGATEFYRVVQPQP